MGATTVAAALSDFKAISQTVESLNGGSTAGSDDLSKLLESDLESQEAVVDKAGVYEEAVPDTR